jgi:eukaryotic-like serine/threonine-protein kinase
MAITPGMYLGRYEIRSKLGAGGMGEVYLAQDTQLRRPVAIKFLPPEFSAQTERLHRFEQEAYAVAALNHPNIAHVYEIGEADGTRFIVMEFIDGQTLRELIRSGDIDLMKLLGYLQHAAEGLAKAHAAGIVHRDLKPDNFMVTRDGHTKVLDFGLAKLVGPQPSTTRTGGGSEVATAILQQHSTPGIVVGTVGYMSPEQAQGKTDQIDHRSDIFSFGCILFEVVTGRKAFEGRDAIDILNNIIRGPVPSVSGFRPDAPNHLQRIVRRCLAKDPEERYQTIKDVAIELKELRREFTTTTAGMNSAVSRTAVGSTRRSTTNAEPVSLSTTESSSSAEYIINEIKQHRLNAAVAVVVLVLGAVGLYLYLHGRSTEVAIDSIAVLPFVNESSNPDVEYLSDGMTESLINSLSQLPNLLVKARSSVFRYKGKEFEPQQVGSELNVQAILNGRLVQRGDDLTLYLSLVDGRNGNQLWGEQYNRKLTNLVTLQNEIARDVANKLRTRLSGADEQKLAKKYTENVEANLLYLHGRFYLNKRTPDALKRALEYFKRAIALDSNYALAYAGLADAYTLSFEYASLTYREAISQAREAALKALSLDNELAEAHASLGLILLWGDYDFAGAEREFKRAIELNPNYAPAHQWYGYLLTTLGKTEEALSENRRAVEIEPLSLVMNFTYASSLFFARRYDEAIAQAKKALELDANSLGGHFWLGNAYAIKGDYAPAVDAFAKSLEVSGDAESGELMRKNFAKGGWLRFLRGVLEDRTTAASPYRLAHVHVLLGNKDEAFAQLNKSYEIREPTFARLKVDPRFDALRDDPRFQDLLRRVGFPS